MVNEIAYPHRLGGSLPLGVTDDGQIVGVDASAHILVAGALGSGCSSVLRVLITSALVSGLRVTAVDGTAPSYFSQGSARHNYDAIGGSLLDIEDGTVHPRNVIADIVSGRRERPDLLVIDDAFDLSKVNAAELVEIYHSLERVGVRVAARVLTARVSTRDSYGTRILMGNATPMDRHLMLGNPEAPRVRRGDPAGTGVIRYHDGAEARFRSYWVAPGALVHERANAS